MNAWVFRSIWFSGVLLIAGLLHWFFELNFYFAVGLVAVALVFTGLIAEWEDNQPGGFNNPNDGQKE